MVTVIPPVLLNSCIIPGVYCKAEAFEAYVCSTLFPKEKFALIHRSVNHPHPVFTFQDLVTGFEFSAECIFRLGFIANSFQCATGITNKKAAHFLVLGLGGTAQMPNQVFLIDSSICSRTVLFKRHLQGKSINPGQAVSSSQLWQKNMIPDYPEKKVA
ncbi:hypothetical protein [Agriterribacter sp.]|uniref:hypothetical protein n=1 Tax=Agriterribacter sp. TaxID=2821509 RepID=UPI002C793FB4|nr:hypothetical protein [Agriterribacter sp.]HRO45996.1 hypothetical protein [Agriterribacter sp.]HRQ17032.1 hypothetical protein [Agriterribacter sp.]